MNPEQVGRLARLLVGYSLAVRPGDVVLVSGGPASEHLIDSLFREVIMAGGLPIIRLSPDLCLDVECRFDGADADRYLNPLGVANGRSIDCTIGIRERDSSLSTDPLLNTPSRIAAQTKFLRHMVDGRLRWVSTLYPTVTAAQHAGLPLKEFTNLVCRAARLNMADPARAWQQVHQRQQRLCDLLAQACEIRLVNSLGTDLTVNVAGRHWVNCAGRFNLPDGEVFTAPLENFTHGVLSSSGPLEYAGHILDGVRLVFRDGCVTDASASIGERVLYDMLDQDHGARVLGEVALGTNEQLTRFSGISLLDEKVAGTAHVALGSSYPQTGGTNHSGIHFDIVLELRHGGSILVDSQPFSVFR